MFKVLMFIGPILIMFCIFTKCIIPCVRGMVSRMISYSLVAYVTVPDEEEGEDDEYEANVMNDYV